MAATCRVNRTGRGAPERISEGGEQQQPGDRHGKVAVRQFDQQAVAPGVHIAKIGKLILGMDGDGAGVAVQGARLSDEIERDVCERKLFLQRRRVTRPFRQAMAKDQRIVRATEQLQDERALLDGDGGGGHGPEC